MRSFRFLLFCMVLAISQPAAAYCSGWNNDDPRYYSVEREFMRARYVATIRVKSEIWLGLDGKPRALKGPFQNGASRPQGFDEYIGAYYDVDLQQKFKGAVPHRFRLFSENSTARFWLSPGQSYVVFIMNDRFENPVNLALTVDTCGNSPVVLSNASRLIRKIKKLM